MCIFTHTFRATHAAIVSNVTFLLCLSSLHSFLRVHHHRLPPGRVTKLAINQSSSVMDSGVLSERKLFGDDSLCVAIIAGYCDDGGDRGDLSLFRVVRVTDGTTKSSTIALLRLLMRSLSNHADLQHSFDHRAVRCSIT